MLPAILAEVSRAISSVSRVTKRQGCSGLKDLASILGPSLGEESSGRRLIRRVLSQVPGRTWEGKEELLEAVVALCAAGKGSAITLEPFVWGGEGGGGGGEASSRGVKRNRTSELEDEEEHDGEAVAATAQSSSGQLEESSSATAGAEGIVRGTDGAASSSSDGDNETTDGIPGGTDDGPAFEYKDKVGDLDKDAAGPAAAAPGGAVQAQREDDQPRKDAALEAGLASLDMEDDSPTPFGDVVTLMLSQLRRKDNKFGRAAASSLAALLDAFPECCVYDLVAPTLLDLAGLDGAAAAAAAAAAGTTSGGGKEDPIMQARAVACLAAAWPRVPAPPASPSAPAPDAGAAAAAAAAAAAGRTDAVCNVQRAHAASLTRALSGAILLKVWSVRVPIYGALSAIVSRTTTAAESRAPVLTGSLLADVVQAVELGADDAKYSQVRAAAISVVGAMTCRKELRLALMPHKEGLAAAARTAAQDPEPKVAVVGSKAAQNLSWWP
ncbi:unnamed protein product [Ectocarpus fasciculatus]